MAGPQLLKLGVASALMGACTLILACKPKSPPVNLRPEVVVQFDPTPPVVGVNTVTITAQDAFGQPLHLEDPRLEGDMNHAGMKPTFGQLKETSKGHYTGTIEFTMGGDWFLLLSGQLSGGVHFTKKVDVPGVKSK
jgi:hypothetical protein